MALLRDATKQEFRIIDSSEEWHHRWNAVPAELQFQLENETHISVFTASRYEAVERPLSEQMSYGSTPAEIYPPGRGGRFLLALR